MPASAGAIGNQGSTSRRIREIATDVIAVVGATGRSPLLTVLKIRFNFPASHPLAAQIAAVDVVERLKTLHRTAVQVSSRETFGRLWDQEQG